MWRVAGISDNQGHIPIPDVIPPLPPSPESEDAGPLTPRSVSPPTPEEPDSPVPEERFDVEQQLSSLHAEINAVKERLGVNLVRYQRACRLIEHEIADLTKQIKTIASFDPFLVKLMTDHGDNDINEPLSPSSSKQKLSISPHPSVTHRQTCQQKYAEMIHLRKERVRIKEQFLKPALKKVSIAREEYAKSIAALSQATQERFHVILQEGLHQWVQDHSEKLGKQAFVVVQRIQQAYYLSQDRLDLSGFGLKVLPAAIAAVRSVEIMALQDNQLTELPSTFRLMSQLSCLDLSGNQFEHIPASIPKTVKYLFFYNNPASHNEAEIQAFKDLMGPNLSIYTKPEVAT